MMHLDSKTVADEVKAKGWMLIPNFLTAGECENLRSEIDQSLEFSEARVQTGMGGADKRLFGFEKISHTAREDILENPWLGEIFSSLYGSRISVCSTLLAQRIRLSEQKDAEAAWHRDAFFSQYKAFIFLSDVSANSAPHQIYRHTHTVGHKIKTLLKLGWKYRNHNDGYRKTDTRRKILSETNDVLTIVCPKGSLLLSNTSSIHRSGRCEAPNQRYSITVYTYANQIPSHVGELIEGV